MVYSSTNPDITEMYLNLEKSDEHDAPALVGVDATCKQQEAIRNGEEIGCVSQQPYAMGYQTIGQQLKQRHRRNLL